MDFEFPACPFSFLATFLAAQHHRGTVDFLIKKLNVPTDQLGRFFWKGVEYLEMPPLYAAIISEQWESSHYLSLADNLIQKDLCYGDRFPHFLDSIVLSNCTRRQKIDFLELMGAAYLLHRDNESREEMAMKRSEYGLLCWTKAMHLRELTTDGGPAYPKVPYNLSELAQKSFENIMEFRTSEQLDQIRR